MNAVYNMKTLCLDRPNYQDFRKIVLFVLKLIASTIDIYPLLPPYKASERKDHKTGYQQSKLSGISFEIYGLHSQTIAHIES